MATNDNSLEEMAVALAASGDYRVLRRLGPRAKLPVAEGSILRQAVFVDVETTGLDTQRDEVIELAMAPFLYDQEGRVIEVGEAWQGFNQPQDPIPSNITSITGISDEMVQGKRIDPAEVAEFISGAALIIAHNAAFDRRFLERLSDAFKDKPWACSMSDVDWPNEGFEGSKLDYLATQAGFFYDKHRAVNDCLAGIELLAMPLPVSGVSGMARLLEHARKPSWRIWAENSPFDFKDHLKARGYKWNGDGGAQPRAWYLDIGDDGKEPELAYLMAEIYQGEVDLRVRRITARDRYSDRA